MRLNMMTIIKNEHFAITTMMCARTDNALILCEYTRDVVFAAHKRLETSTPVC